MTRFLILFVLFSISLVGCNGCDDEQLRPTEGDECLSNHCPGIADCDNGFCLCPEGAISIARGFCVQDTDGANFVTYDRYPNLLDTTIVHFDEEPFDMVWRNGDPINHVISGATYNRSSLTINTVLSSIGVLVYPGDPAIPVDTVVIDNIYDKRSIIPGGYRQDGWQCRGVIFIGRFIDRNTIKGEISVNLCESETETELPENLQNFAAGSFPVTYHRLE